VVDDRQSLDTRISDALIDKNFVAFCQRLSAIIIGRDCAPAELPTLCKVIHIIYCRIRYEESGSLEHAIDAYRTVREAEIPIPDWLLPAMDKIAAGARPHPGRRKQLDARVSLLTRAIGLKTIDPGITQEKAAEHLGIANEQLCRTFAAHPSVENPWKSAKNLGSRPIDR